MPPADGRSPLLVGPELEQAEALRAGVGVGRAAAGVSRGESSGGPVPTRAPAGRWLAVATAAVGLAHRREVCFRPARLKK
jgi:hypothetical protein